MKTPGDVLEIFLQPGEFYFGDEKTRIRTLLGSCVAITMWHPKLNIGGMCHYMLPQNRRKADPKNNALDGRYAVDAMQMFLREIKRSRTKPADYQVKLFGGGRMFTHSGKANRPISVSEQNVEFGHAIIKQYGFKLMADDLGGDGHRNIILDLWSGDVWVRTAKRVMHIEPRKGHAK
ncbi:MAG: chemotaxis protein CheD [Betaproteobacteria bacterium RBG_16_56_24]|nr:MAG: chemotaxis protein CheD [Betaproteobacteria bacterium RBG_16_56_24]